MSGSTCPSCGARHGAQRRYCLRCGALAGERPVGLEEILAAAGERDPEARPAAPPLVATAAPRGVWRRPGASALVASALALGLAGGFLLGPEGGAAQRTPVVLGGVAASAAPPAAAASVAVPGTTATPPDTEGTVDLKPSKKAAAAAPTTTAAASVPSATTTTTTAARADTTPAEDDAAPGGGGRAGDGGREGDTSTAAAPAAGALPPIDHVWLIAVTGALPERDDSYLGDVLRAHGTLLSGYAPDATDPLAGAEALVGGAAPTLAGQLIAKHDTVKVYASGDAACARNPFAAFASATGDAATCSGADQLAADLGAGGGIPAFSYILPDPSADAAGLDRFLERVVAPIRRTDAYKSGGLIAIVPTAAGSAGATGALLLSPFAAEATSVGGAAGPGVLLRTFEDLFALDPLGLAARDDVSALGSDVLAG